MQPFDENEWPFFMYGVVNNEPQRNVRFRKNSCRSLGGFAVDCFELFYDVLERNSVFYLRKALKICGGEFGLQLGNNGGTFLARNWTRFRIVFWSVLGIHFAHLATCVDLIHCTLLARLGKRSPNEPFAFNA
jgi:hypothetical protein